jgi:predicted amidophosphoribosyltransferase
MNKEMKPVKEPRRCPYCDDDIAEASFPYCQACGERVAGGPCNCPTCGTDAPKETGPGK